MITNAIVGVPVIAVVMRMFDVTLSELLRAMARPAIGWIAMTAALLALQPAVVGPCACAPACDARRRRGGRLRDRHRAVCPEHRHEHVVQSSVHPGPEVGRPGSRRAERPPMTCAATARAPDRVAQSSCRGSARARCAYTGAMTISSVYGTLWRYRVFILLTTALLAGAAYLATTRQTKMYTASSLIRVQQRVTSANDIYGALQTGERLARTYAKVATTSSVAAQIRKQLPPSVPDDAIDINATQVSNLELLELSGHVFRPAVAAGLRMLSRRHSRSSSPRRVACATRSP